VRAGAFDRIYWYVYTIHSARDHNNCLQQAEEADEIIGGLLNEQSELLWSWRSDIHGLLTRKLTTGDEEVDGEEYLRTLETQGEVETYLRAYAALLADRREAIVAERTLLATHDYREKKLRHTKAAIKAANAAAALRATFDIPEDDDLEPEYEVLHKELSDKRKALIKPFEGRALKSVLFDLNAIAARLRDNDKEKLIVKQCVMAIRQLINEQGQ
jgi:E3 ubiquitin-protein ligase SHPRH